MHSSILTLLLVSTCIGTGVHGFLADSVLNITQQNGNLTCQLGTNSESLPIYQFCAIRVYEFLNGTQGIETVNLFNGFSFTNIFGQFAKRRNCAGFESGFTTGFSRCDPLSYESFNTVILCICATDRCNSNLTSCQTSVQANKAIMDPPNLMVDIPSTIQCSKSSNISYTCAPTSDYAQFVNSSMCETDVRSQSVLCAVDDVGSSREQQALVVWNYDMFLSERLQELKSLLQVLPGTIIYEANSYVYVNYTGTTGYEQHCVCTQSPLCNFDYATCAPQTSAIVTTTEQTITKSSLTTVSTTISPNSTTTGMAFSSTVTDVTPTSPATSLTTTGPGSTSSITSSITTGPTSSSSTGSSTTSGLASTSPASSSTIGDSSSSSSATSSTTGPTSSSSAAPSVTTGPDSTSSSPSSTNAGLISTGSVTSVTTGPTSSSSTGSATTSGLTSTSPATSSTIGDSTSSSSATSSTAGPTSSSSAAPSVTTGPGSTSSSPSSTNAGLISTGSATATTSSSATSSSSSNALTIGLAVGISVVVIAIIFGIIFAKCIYPKFCGSAGRSSAYLV